jgi:hypothetical protein
VADVLIVPAQLDDAVLLAQNLRDSDRAEMRAYGHTDSDEVALRRCVATSVLAWSAYIDGELACILGVSPLSMVSGIGSPWMMGTPVLDAHSRILVRMTPEYIARMLKAFPHLVNFVHTKNRTSVRWLRRLGFTLHEAMPYGALGEPFHKFEMRG